MKQDQGRNRLAPVNVITHLEEARRAQPQSAPQWHDLAYFTVDAEELGLDPWYFEQFLEAYMRRVEIDKDTLLEKLERPLTRVRNKHWARYGIYAPRLV